MTVSSQQSQRSIGLVVPVTAACSIVSTCLYQAGYPVDRAIRRRLLDLSLWLKEPRFFADEIAAHTPGEMVQRSIDETGLGDSRRAALVVGPRQAGKSTFVRNHLAGSAPDPVLFLDAEEPQDDKRLTRPDVVSLFLHFPSCSKIAIWPSSVTPPKRTLVSAYKRRSEDLAPVAFLGGRGGRVLDGGRRVESERRDRRLPLHQAGVGERQRDAAVADVHGRSRV